MADSRHNWHALTVQEVLTELRVTLGGFSPAEVEERRRLGSNVVKVKKSRSNFVILLSQFKSPLIVILFIAAIVAFSFREQNDGWIILFILVFNGFVGYTQEFRAGQAMERLRSMASQLVRVVRDGEQREIIADDIVLGDIVVLESGVVVPADGRLGEAVNLKINEAVFTGESVPAEKHTKPLAEITPISERRNFAWRGTTVVSGNGRLIVTEVGINTRYGTIVQEVAEIPETDTPFQRNVGEFARRLSVGIIIVSLGILLFILVRGTPLEQAILLSISLIVSLIPEGLPVVITLTFALGMRQMARRRALIRKLVAVETLGSVTVIASDKTGTLTFGEMMVEEIFVDGRRISVTGEGFKPKGDFLEHGQPVLATDIDPLRRLIEVGALNNDSRPTHAEDDTIRWLGDPTEICLSVLAEKAGFRRDDLTMAFPRVGEFSFDFKLKYMVTFHLTTSGKSLIAAKGAPRQIIALCARQLTSQGVRDFRESDREALRRRYEDVASRGLRGLAMAFAETESDWRSVTHENLSSHLIFLGLVGVRDPIRAEAAETIRAAKGAGIRVVMLTGDYQITAKSVAKEIGILEGGSSELIDGSDLDGMTDEELAGRLPSVTVFSRVTPEQKLRLARLFKSSGEIVAMTGDGINDVPALREANIGVAIGMNSTDAAKDASEMVLTDGNLSSIVAAIEEGRVIYRNIQRVLMFLMASNVSGLILIYLTIHLKLPLPLLPVQIIWLNFLTDPFLALGLAREPKSPAVMKEKPRRPQAPILTRGHWGRILLSGSTVALAGLAALFIARSDQRSTTAMYSLVLTTVAFGEWFVAFINRSSIRSTFAGLLRNQLMLGALALVILMHAAILYVPSFARAFHLAPLAVRDWIMAIGLAFSVVIVDEIRKAVVRYRKRWP